MKNKIAVLGGSFLQADFVEAALARQLAVYVLDGNKNCHISSWESVAFNHLDFSNLDLLNTFCRKNQINFIYAPSNELGNKVAAKMAGLFKYRYNSPEVVEITLNKSLQRIVSNSCNLLNRPKSILYNDNIDEIESKIPYPMVIKPTSSSAGRGVTGVTNRYEFFQAVQTAKEFTRQSGDVVVEEFLPGDQISVETVSAEGQHYIVGITLETIGPPPLFIERCHHMNSDIHDFFYPKVFDVVQELLSQIGIQYGPCHIEMKVYQNKVSLVEIASRSGGLRDRLMKMAGYPDYNNLILDCYLNGKVDQECLYRPTRHGLVNILTKCEDLLSVGLGQKDNTFHSVYFNGKEPVNNPQNIIDAYGYAYFFGNNPLRKYALEGC
jgi:carbamoylphosphate synthase large subunit